MAASQEQKVDFLLKKIGYTASKSGIAEDSSLSGTKKAPFAEPIPSPLVIANSSLWAESSQIPGTPPTSTTDFVGIYTAGTSGFRMTVDSTVSGNRTFIARSSWAIDSSSNSGDWIDTQFGSDYIVKVWMGDPSGISTSLSAAGSGSNDTWFFDYSSGILNFNGTAVPTGVTTSNIYLTGYRYKGIKGAIPPGAAATVTSLLATGITTFAGAIDANSTLDVDGDTQLDDLNVTGVATFSALVDVNNRIDVVGGANIDQLNVAGVSTYG